MEAWEIYYAATYNKNWNGIVPLNEKESGERKSTERKMYIRGRKTKIKKKGLERIRWESNEGEAVSLD